MEGPLSVFGTTLLGRIKLDRACGEALSLQLRDLLERAILDGDLEPGSRLPSTRALARRLRVSRNTVLNAYEGLAAEGLVTSLVGSGTVVGRKPLASKRRPLNPRRMLKDSHYPSDAKPMKDPDGNAVYIHR